MSQVLPVAVIGAVGVVGLVRGALLTVGLGVLGVLAAANAIASLVGLFTGNRRLWLGGAAVTGVCLVLGGLAGIAVVRSGINRAEQGVELASATGHEVYNRAEGLAGSAADGAESLLDVPGEAGCPSGNPLDDAVERFEHITCLALDTSDTVEVAHSSDDHFLGEGTLHVVLDVEPATIDRWLTLAPFGPGRDLDWSGGPVPDLPDWVDFDGDDGLGDGWEAAAAGGDDVHWAALSVADVLGTDDDYSSGDVVVIDQAAGRVWFASWDS